MISDLKEPLIEKNQESYILIKDNEKPISRISKVKGLVLIVLGLGI